MSNFLRPPCDTALTFTSMREGREDAGAKRWVLVVSILGSSMAFIDSTVVNVALPVMQSDFHAGIRDMQWIIESYALFLTALVLVGGSLGDHLGRRLIFGIGIAIFTLASLWCGLSPSVGSLILARSFQGIGAAMSVPGSLALLSAAYPEEERGRAIGTWSGFSGLTAAAGPVLGGWFVQHLSWRWAFFINVPLGAIVLFLVFTRVPKSKAVDNRRIDWTGATLATLSLTLIVYGLLEIPELGWRSIAIQTLLIGGIVVFAAFVIFEKRSPAPMMPVDVFQSRNFSGANLLTLLLYAALSGALFFLPFHLIQVQDYSPLQAGSALLPFVAIMFILSRWAGGLVMRFGPRGPLTIGPAVAGAGFLLMARLGVHGAYWRSVFPAVTILGLGMVITVAPLTTTVMDSVSAARAGAASGINNAVARLAGLLAIALLGLVIQSTFSTKLQQQLGKMDLPPSVEQEIQQQHSKLAGIEIPSSVDSSSRERIRESVNSAFASAFDHVAILCAIISAMGAVVAAAVITRAQAETR